MKNIAVIFGGKSVEHDISIITALQAMKSLPSKYNVFPVYIKPNGQFVWAENLQEPETFLDYEKRVRKEMEILPVPAKKELCFCKRGKKKYSKKIDCALLCCHGHGGEDGSLQGMLELCGIPYTSPSVASSAVCMDKVLTKIVLEYFGIDTPAYVHFDKSEYEANKSQLYLKIEEEFGFPCIIKPARLGSSVGINICECQEKFDHMLSVAFAYDEKVLVEKFIKNAREFSCAVVKVGGKVIVGNVNEVQKGDMFTFEEKYISYIAKNNHEIEEKLEWKIRDLAERCYKILECDGVVRVDFLMDGAEKILYINEINTIPGSLAFNMFNTPFVDLIEVLIAGAKSKKNKSEKTIYNFNSNAIESYIKLSNSAKYGK